MRVCVCARPLSFGSGLRRAQPPSALRAARALLRQTKLVVMDEPSSHVDEHTPIAPAAKLDDAEVQG